MLASLLACDIEVFPRGRPHIPRDAHTGLHHLDVRMHELNATQAMIDRAIHQATEKHAARITDVHIVIGAISGFSEDPVRFYWGELSKSTLAEGARLHFRRIEGELQCMACFTRYRAEGDEIRCPACGSTGAKILSGEEFYMEALDVE